VSVRLTLLFSGQKEVHGGHARGRNVSVAAAVEERSDGLWLGLGLFIGAEGR
jgi:hypothetical protein